MRAAYIAVHSEKQVIVLCPSTVLADQHYESFLERFKSFPVNIKLLTRHTKMIDKKDIIRIKFLFFHLITFFARLEFPSKILISFGLINFLLIIILKI